MNDITPKHRQLLPALVIAACAAMFTMALLGLQPLRSSLYWWYVTTGEFIATWQVIPDRQLFLYTAPAEQPWVYDSWLGSVLLYHFHELAGPELTLLLRNVACALSAAMVAFTMARRHDRLAPVLIPPLLIGTTALLFAHVGPAIIALPIATIGILGVYQTIERPRRYAAALLLPASILLTINIHFATAAVLIIVGLVTSIELFRRYRTKGDKRILISALLTATSIPAIFGFAYGPQSWPMALSTTATTAIIPILAILATLTLATITARRGPKLPRTKPVIAALIIFSIAAVALQPGVDTRRPIVTSIHSDVRTEAPLAGIINADLPLRCAEELRRTGRELRVFNEPEHAGFLLYHLLNPKTHTPFLFNDHRHLLDEATTNTLDLIRTEPIARGIFNQNEINAVVIDRQDHKILFDDLTAAREWHDITINPEHPVACFIKVGRR